MMRWFVGILVALFVVGALLIVWHISTVSRRLSETAARANGQRYSEALTAFRHRYASEVVARVQDHGIEVTHDYQNKDAAIPLPATLTIDLGEEIATQRSGAKVRLFSDYPFPWRKNRTLNAFQRSAIDRLRADPNTPVESFDWENGQMRYATADLMQQSCVDCHNSHLDSPKIDWRVNDVRGVLEVTLPMNDIAQETSAVTRQTVLLMILLGGLGAVGLAFTLIRVRHDSHELKLQSQQTEAALKQQLETNDELDRRSAALEDANADIKNRHKALADANRALEQRTELLAATHNSVRAATEKLLAAAAQIRKKTAEQTKGAEEQSAAVLQIVATVENLGSFAEQTSDHANEVAQSARKTSEAGAHGRSTIEHAKAIMNQVKDQVDQISQSILAFSVRAQAIGDITESVAVIAEQTNSLALNAAIEASRAGKHGRAFSVVAGEIKGLSEQSKKLTGRVGQILDEIQKAAGAAVTSIEKGSNSVETAARTVASADAVIKTLGEALAESSRSADNILSAANNQAVAVTQVNHGLRNVSDVTKNNVAAIAEIELVAQTMHQLSIELAELAKSANQ